MIRPSSFAVRALKFLQKSMMFTPAWPRAGPTGGAGVALPPGICNLLCAVTFFIRSFLCVSVSLWLKLFDLEEIQLHRRRAAEDRDHDLQGVAVEVHLFHH